MQNLTTEQREAIATNIRGLHNLWDDARYTVRQRREDVREANRQINAANAQKKNALEEIAKLNNRRLKRTREMDAGWRAYLLERAEDDIKNADRVLTEWFGDGSESGDLAYAETYLEDAIRAAECAADDLRFYIYEVRSWADANGFYTGRRFR